MKFVISIEAKQKKTSKTTLTAINLHGAEIDPTLTVAEVTEGIDATEKFLSRLAGCIVSIDLARSE